jgi:hypothetical protein
LSITKRDVAVELCSICGDLRVDSVMQTPRSMACHLRLVRPAKINRSARRKII